MVKRIISFSGGKDSTAMLLRMMELEMPFDEIVFCDTGVEMPETIAFILKVEKRIGMKITTVRPEPGVSWDNYFYRIRKTGNFKDKIMGMPPTVQRGCWARSILKLQPFYKIREKGDIIYLGITAEEQNRIQKGTRGYVLKYPLIEWDWDSEKCLEFCKQKKLLNPLYKYVRRTGCWLCPKQSIKSLEYLWKFHSNLWEKLKKYEKDSPFGFKPDVRLKDLERRWTQEAESFDISKIT